MNKKYTYIDGKVIISDENGKQKPVEYYDKLDEVLVQENLIETMENRIEELKRDSRFYKKNNRKRYIPLILPIAAFLSTIGFNLIIYFLSGFNPFMSSIGTMFGNVNAGLFYSLFFSTFFLPLGTLLEIGSYRLYKDEKGKEEGTNNELEFLQKQLTQEKQTLEELKKEKKRDEEDKEFRVVEVDDKQQLKALKRYLSLYFDLGYNGEKYFKYYEQGKLEEKLKKYYSDEDIEVAKAYLEEKGPTLVRKKK